MARRGRRRSPAMEAAAVDQWNATFPVGAAIFYKEDDGKMTETRTTSEAQMLGGHTGVIWIEGRAGCVALDRVRLRTEPIAATADSGATRK